MSLEESRMNIYPTAVIVVFLAHMAVTTVYCQQCPTHSPNGTFCFCDPGDNFVGWKYSCSNEDTLKLYMDITYVVDRKLTFRCGTNEPYRDPYFKHEDFSHIQTFSFISCPLPNSFAEILPTQNVEQLNIQMKSGNNTFTDSLFKKISSNMTNLLLNHNSIRHLPEKIFNSLVRLEFLSLSDNFLEELPEKIFWELANLEILELHNNRLETLPRHLFQGLFQLKKLYLFKNKLQVLPSALFNGLLELQVLDLADNKLSTLPEDIFTGLSQLIHIRLRANLLKSLPKELFNHTESLQDISMSLNKFQEALPEQLLFKLSYLVKVDISFCNLTQIHEDFFSYSRKVTHINLEGNSITSVPVGLFRSNPELQEINLNNNRVSSLPKNLFPNQKNLEKLYLFQNNLSYLPPGLFRQARNVKSLILGGNQIVSAGKEIFQELPEVEVIDLSKNNLSHFSLDRNEHVRRIDLSHNQLKEMPSIFWPQHLKIESFNLQYNKLTSVSIPILYSANKKNPPTMNLGYNAIRLVDVRDISFYDLNINITKDHYDSYIESFISLYPNPFVCDCNLYSFYDYLRKVDAARKRSVRFTDYKNLQCSEPPDLKGKRVVLLSPDQLRCSLNDNCEPPCKCFYRAEDRVNIVDCSDSSLDILPEVVPFNTSILYFQGNNLNDVSHLNASVWENLTELHLDGNKIRSLENLYLPPKLNVLTLQGNLLKSISPSVLNFTSHSDNFQLSLSDNPWSCNCSTMYFKKWITEHYQKVSDVKNVRCFNSISENDTDTDLIVSIPDDIMCPINDWPYRLQLISVTTVCVILALLLFIVSVLYYRNKQTVIAYVYIHLHNVFMCFFNEEDMDEDKIFDAFVSYSGTDRDVALSLLQELEKKEPYFKLCIHERNWLPGNLISWNIINSVQNSRRTILVVSKEFLESMWFQVEFHAAYYQMLEDKIDRLIVIVKGDLPPKDSMDKELQHLLSTKTYLVWGEKWFWEKLRYALPHKKRITLNSDIMALKDKPDCEKVKCVENQIAVLSNNKSVQQSKQNGTNNALNHIMQNPANNNKTTF